MAEEEVLGVEMQGAEAGVEADFEWAPPGAAFRHERVIKKRISI